MNKNIPSSEQHPFLSSVLQAIDDSFKPALIGIFPLIIYNVVMESSNVYRALWILGYVLFFVLTNVVRKAISKKGL